MVVAVITSQPTNQPTNRPTNSWANAKAATATGSTADWKAALPDHVRVDEGGEGGEEGEQATAHMAGDQQVERPEEEVQRQVEDGAEFLQVDSQQAAQQDDHAHQSDEPVEEVAVGTVFALNQVDNEINQH